MSVITSRDFGVGEPIGGVIDLVRVGPGTKPPIKLPKKPTKK